VLLSQFSFRFRSDFVRSNWFQGKICARSRLSMQFQRGRDKCSQIYSLMHDRLAPRSRLLLHSPLITSDRGFGLNWNTESLLTFADSGRESCRAARRRCEVSVQNIQSCNSQRDYRPQEVHSSTWCSCKSRSRQSHRKVNSLRALW
jgi:hypothetical protein